MKAEQSEFSVAASLTDTPDQVAQTISDKSLTVLKAARLVFLEHGFSGATTDMIQRESGVSKSTVYSYYPNKSALFRAVVEAECIAFSERIQKVDFEPGNPRDSLSKLAHAYLGIILSDSALALYRVVIAEAPRFPELAATFYKAGPQGITLLIAGRLLQAARLGILDIDESSGPMAAEVFIELVRGHWHTYRLMHPSAHVSDELLERRINDAISLFLKIYHRS
ncbi:TetR/AcrR family transcriptional regulator [Rhizobium leguminosarum]|uniref:TetR/AcrR family transcriptional regulator n=1 Tax=Rhizobium leguminosarum TaxID=384 RepID=UPI003F953A85